MPSDDAQKPLRSLLKSLIATIFSHKKPDKKNLNSGKRLRSVGALRGILIPLGIIIAHDIFSKNSSIRKLISKFTTNRQS